MLKTTEKIITIEDLAQETHQAMSNAQREPLVVTENGRPTAYLISIELFDSLLAQLEALENKELVNGIAIGEDQFASGAYTTLEEARTILEKVWQRSAIDE
ncbi:MAG: type II toxin-antitoxin system prevent-host-death family antitoxin [Candidatus Promineifilaceae bacterium]